MSVTVYSWRIKDKRTERWRKLRWQMTEQDAAEWVTKEGVPIEKIEGSEVVRTDLSGRGATFIPAQSTGAIENYFNGLEGQETRKRSDHR